MDEPKTNNQITASEPSDKTIKASEPIIDLPIQNEEELRKKMEAILEMEGEEGRERRERAENKKHQLEMISELELEKTKLLIELQEITKYKENLELKWIDLSNKKDSLQKLLDPILSAEMNAEKDVQVKNQEEHATDDPKARQIIEKERQEIESKRQMIEKEKWVIEDKMSEILTIMNENKIRFQGVLKNEYLFIDKVKEIEEKIKSIKVI
jgi:hypothetical protein